MLKELGIEKKLEWLMAEMRSLHNRLDAHTWIRDHRPWMRKVDRHRGAKERCTSACDHHEFYVECICGEVCKATKEQFDAAEQQWDGY